MSSRREEKFMRMVLDLAAENVTNGSGCPFAAIIVKGDEVIATGINHDITTNDPTSHAEIRAMRTASAQLDSPLLVGCEVYTSCEPCPMCLGALYWARPDCIYYAATRDDAVASGFADSFIYDDVMQEFSKRNISTIPLLTEEACRPFDVWEKKEDRVRY